MAAGSLGVDDLLLMIDDLGELKGYGTFSGRGRAEEWRPVALGSMIHFLSSLGLARPVFHDSPCAVA